jgi:hypothetical protein
MRDALKNHFSNQINLGDNSQFSFTISPYELTNALGSTIVILREYKFTKMDDKDGQFSCKLYKTKEGNWYDIEDSNRGVEKAILRMLKSAVEVKENIAVTGM